MKILERRLNERPPDPSIRYEVMNLGMSGYGTANAFFLYTSEGVRYDPDLVILAFVTGNDFRNNSRELEGYPFRPYLAVNDSGQFRWDLSYKEALRERLSGWRGNLTKATRRSFLLSFVRERVKLLFTPQRRNVIPDERVGWLQQSHDWNIYLLQPPPVWEETMRLTEQAILRFRDRVREDESDFLLVTLTNNAQLSDKVVSTLDRALGQGNYDLAKPDRYLSDFAEREEIDLLQLLPVFIEHYASTGTYFHGFENVGGEGSGGHWNERGHSLAAETMYEFLSRYIPLKQSRAKGK